MNIEFRMPSLGADMEYGILTEWKIAPGDAVNCGDVVAVIETEKGAIDLEISERGKVRSLLVTPGTKVPVGGVLALLEGEGSLPAGVTNVAAVPATPAATTSTTAPAGMARKKISPAARVRARELALDVEAIIPADDGGIVTLQDVESAAAGVRRPPAAAAGMRDVIAAAMARSKREIPHYYLSLLVDYSAARTWLDQFNAKVAVADRILPVVPLLKATALAAQQVAGFNGFYSGGRREPSHSVHLGVAISQRGGGLIAPAILDANQQTLPALMRSLSDLVGRVRSGHLKSSELSAGTLTLTNLGEDSVDGVFPIIYPPQVAIVGAGTIAPRPWPVEDRIESRMTVQLCLAADHRVSDGRAGSRFLSRIRDLLQSPERL